MIRVHFFGDRTLAYSVANVPSRFYLGDLVTRTGDQEIRSVSGRLPDYPGALACMRRGPSLHIKRRFVSISNIFIQNTIMFACQLLKYVQVCTWMRYTQVWNKPLLNLLFCITMCMLQAQLSANYTKKRKKKGWTTTFHKIQSSKNCNKWKWDTTYL